MCHPFAVDASEPHATVVIATRNRPELLARVLDALRAQRTERAFEVIVVDDGTTPPLGEATVADLPAAKVVSGEGRGPGAARNIGVGVARGPVVLFTDDDTVPDLGWVDAACSFLDRHPEMIGVEGPVASPPFDPLYAHSVIVDHPGRYVTCNIAYRRVVFERVGGFDEGIPTPHCEDLDLAYRAQELGEIGYAETMHMVHPPRPQTLSALIARARMASSEVVLFRRHRERFGRARVLPPRVFALVSAGHHWWRLLRSERTAIVRPPARALRFVVAATASLGLAAFTVLTQRLHEPSNG
jgi:GT2 family glycosyltransferase